MSKLEEIKQRYSSLSLGGTLSIDGKIVSTRDDGTVTEPSKQHYQRQDDLLWLIKRVEKLEAALRVYGDPKAGVLGDIARKALEEDA